MQLKIELHATKQRLETVEDELEQCQQKYQDIKSDKKEKRSQLETLEKKYNDACIRIKRIENLELTAKRDIELMKQEVMSKDKEIAYL